MNTQTTTKKSGVSQTHAQKAHELRDKALMLDVRTPAEFEEAHIEGSVLHPLTDLNPDKVRSMAEGRENCFVICRSGNRAKQAAEKLAAAGLHNVQVLEGGVQAWESIGLPLNRGQKTMSLERQVRIAAGFLVLCGVILAYFVNPAWIALSGFVGAGLIFAGITDTCGMGMIIARMPWNNRRGSCGSGSCCSS